MSSNEAIRIFNSIGADFTAETRDKYINEGKTSYASGNKGIDSRGRRIR